MSHAELRERLLADSETRAAHEDMRPEWVLLGQLLRARTQAGLSPAQVARRMGTTAPAVVRLESSLASGKRSPSVATLRRCAHAVGCDLAVRLVEPSRPGHDGPVRLTDRLPAHHSSPP